MLGRYPGDLYDGGSDSLGDHPWALCTANFAQLYYELATEIEASGSLPLDELSDAVLRPGRHHGGDQDRRPRSRRFARPATRC